MKRLLVLVMTLCLCVPALAESPLTPPCGMTLEDARLMVAEHQPALDEIWALVLGEDWYFAQGLSPETRPLWEDAFDQAGLGLLQRAFGQLRVTSIRLLPVEDGTGVCQAVACHLNVREAESCYLLRFARPLAALDYGITEQFPGTVEPLDDQWLLIYQ